METWLVEVVQLPQYAQIFVENDVDGELLLWLRERNLQEDLEITSLLHRKKITAQIVRTTPADPMPRCFFFLLSDKTLAVPGSAAASGALLGIDAGRQPRGTASRLAPLRIRGAGIRDASQSTRCSGVARP